MYNYMLMFPQLHAWVARTEAGAGIDCGKPMRRSHAFWVAFWEELCAHWRGSYDVGPQSTKLQHVADAFLDMCIGKAEEVERAGAPTTALWNVTGGAGEEGADASGRDQHKGQMPGSGNEFKPGADGWYDVTFPLIPHVYDSMHTRPWMGVWEELIHSPMGADFRMRRSTVEAFGRVYELLGPRYRRRTPWECWYRWAVPLTKVSRKGDHTIEHLQNKSIMVRRVGDKLVDPQQGKAESPLAGSESTAAGSAPSVVAKTCIGAGARNVLDDVRAGSANAAVEDRHRDPSGEEDTTRNTHVE